MPACRKTELRSEHMTCGARACARTCELREIVVPSRQLDGQAHTPALGAANRLQAPKSLRAVSNSPRSTVQLAKYTCKRKRQSRGARLRIRAGPAGNCESGRNWDREVSARSAEKSCRCLRALARVWVGGIQKCVQDKLTESDPGK